MNGFVPENRIISERGKINQTNGGIYHEEKNSSSIYNRSITGICWYRWCSGGRTRTWKRTLGQILQFFRKNRMYG